MHPHHHHHHHPHMKQLVTAGLQSGLATTPECKTVGYGKACK